MWIQEQHNTIESAGSEEFCVNFFGQGKNNNVKEITEWMLDKVCFERDKPVLPK